MKFTLQLARIPAPIGLVAELTRDWAPELARQYAIPAARVVVLRTAAVASDRIDAFVLITAGMPASAAVAASVVDDFAEASTVSRRSAQAAALMNLIEALADADARAPALLSQLASALSAEAVARAALARVSAGGRVLVSDVRSSLSGDGEHTEEPTAYPTAEPSSQPTGTPLYYLAPTDKLPPPLCTEAERLEWARSDGPRAPPPLPSIAALIVAFADPSVFLNESAITLGAMVARSLRANATALASRAAALCAVATSQPRACSWSEVEQFGLARAGSVPGVLGAYLAAIAGQITSAHHALSAAAAALGLPLATAVALVDQLASAGSYCAAHRPTGETARAPSVLYIGQPTALPTRDWLREFALCRGAMLVADDFCRPSLVRATLRREPCTATAPCALGEGACSEDDTCSGRLLCWYSAAGLTPPGVAAPAARVDGTFEYDWARQTRYCYDPHWAAERTGGCLGACGSAAACARSCAERSDCAGFVVWEGQGQGGDPREGAALMASRVSRVSCGEPPLRPSNNWTTFLRLAGSAPPSVRNKGTHFGSKGTYFENNNKGTRFDDKGARFRCAGVPMPSVLGRGVGMPCSGTTVGADACAADVTCFDRRFPCAECCSSGRNAHVRVPHSPEPRERLCDFGYSGRSDACAAAGRKVLRSRRHVAGRPVRHHALAVLRACGAHRPAFGARGERAAVAAPDGRAEGLRAARRVHGVRWRGHKLRARGRVRAGRRGGGVLHGARRCRDSRGSVRSRFCAAADRVGAQPSLRARQVCSDTALQARAPATPWQLQQDFICRQTTCHHRCTHNCARPGHLPYI